MDASKEFWNGFLRAIETKPGQPIESLPGASGLDHPLTAYGLDESRKRLVIILGDSDARSAALAQADLQNKYSDLKVIFARPIAVSLGKVAEYFVQQTGLISIGQSQLEIFQNLGEDRREFLAERGKQIIEGIPALLRGFGYASINWTATIQDCIKQLSRLKVDPLGAAAATTGLSVDNSQAMRQVPTLLLAPLIGFDPSEADRSHGICAVPLYEFTAEQAEVFQRGSDVDGGKEILRQNQILQFFFPAADHLALGLVEKQPLPLDVVTQHLEQSPTFGHPFGQQEILPEPTKIQEMIDALQEKGLCVEGELGFELTGTGKVQRANVRFKPREGLLERLSRIFKIDISLKDIRNLFGPPNP